ncbi:MAG: competence/damage-inducible protein A [Geothermobacteraceae bacterium]
MPQDPDIKVAVLTTGAELLSGELLDSNSRDIARLLGAIGLRLSRIVTVGDRLQEIADELAGLAARFDLVVVTGGLGPTEDDLTTAAASEAFGLPLVENKQARELVLEHFHRLRREPHPANRRQYLLPEGAEVLPNPLGTAPGFLLEQPSCLLAFFPGVPREMHAMVEKELLPHLQHRFPGLAAWQEVRLRVFGISEPEVERLLSDTRLPEVEVGFGVDFPETVVKLRSRDPEALARAEAVVRAALTAGICYPDGASLAMVALDNLARQNLSLSLAESCTGGLIAAALTDIPGASRVLERGAVTYANSAKNDWLGVDPSLLEEHGAVSEACARAMAEGIRAAAGTDIGLAVTGIAGPDGGTTDKPVGTVFLALADSNSVSVEQLALGGSRQRIRILTTMTALARLARYPGEDSK